MYYTLTHRISLCPAQALSVDHETTSRNSTPPGRGLWWCQCSLACSHNDIACFLSWATHHPKKAIHWPFISHLSTITSEVPMSYLWTVFWKDLTAPVLHRNLHGHSKATSTSKCTEAGLQCAHLPPPTQFLKWCTPSPPGWDCSPSGHPIILQMSSERQEPHGLVSIVSLTVHGWCWLNTFKMNYSIIRKQLSCTHFHYPHEYPKCIYLYI